MNMPSRPTVQLACRRLRGSCVVLLLAVAGVPPAFAAGARSESEQSAGRTGELRLGGAHVRRLVLEGEHVSRPIVVESPGETVRLPEGRYCCEQVILAGPAGTPQFLSYLPGGHRWIPIREDEPAVLDVGGPLQTKLRARKQGGTLLLTFELANTSGQTFQPVKPASNPRFEVCQGGRQIASGRFEYG